MMQKAFISSNNKVTFSCPQCKNTRIVDVAAYKALEKAVKIKVHCPCGHDYPVMIERRKQFRKAVSLPGTYTRIYNQRRAGKGTMVVKDVSRNGLSLRVNDSAHMKTGDILEVSFKLDDAKRSAILKEVIIRKIVGYDIGTEFVSVNAGNASDKAIGFYLMG
jgi:hypothetical protein